MGNKDDSSIASFIELGGSTPMLTELFNRQSSIVNRQSSDGLSRRQALLKLAQFVLASPLLSGQELAKTEDPLLHPINVFDFEKLAQAKVDKVAWDYISEGAEDEVSLRDNREAFNRIILRPRFLTDVHKIDLSTTLLGNKLEYPIFICPAGGKNCFFRNGEQETASAAASSNAVMVTNGGIDKFLASGKGPKTWWQYTLGGQLRTKSAIVDFVEKLEDMGCGGICFTVDNMHVSHRERSMRNRFIRVWCEMEGVPRDDQGNLIYKPTDRPWQAGEYPSRPFPTPTWEAIQQLRDLTKLPIIIKGILTAEDTEKCVKTGVSAAVVSNHGARQLDHVGATIEALPECVEAAGGKMPLLIDGGFRRGTDILKALALGATAVGVARPYLWGLASFGQRGVSRVLELLRTELALDMGLAGVARISDINRSLVRIRK
jgi:isopentenyl diphosphate isomerase/L-lactate dehydrogenase-like FMN-dependent dehydrogenase